MKLVVMATAEQPLRAHPNRMPFFGVLALVDTPTDTSPVGTRRHRAILTRKVAESALSTLLGMGVDYRPGWDGHDARTKIGLVTDAAIVEDRLEVRGFLYARDFPGLVDSILAQPSDALGMSYEIVDARVKDMRAAVWELFDVTFTGAAVMRKAHAACKATSFRLDSGSRAAE